MATVTALVITDSVLFNRTGSVRRWTDRVETAFTAHAIAEAPRGSDTGRINKSRQNAAFPEGSLKNSIRGEVVQIGPKQLQTTVSVNVPYATYVLKGTRGATATLARYPAGTYDANLRPIGGRFAPGLRGMYLPANPGWGRSKIVQRTRGQRADNFLGRAYDATARSHSSLRAYSMIGTL